MPQAQGGLPSGGWGGFPDGGMGGYPASGNLANDKIQEILSVSVIRRICIIIIEIIYIYVCV